MKKNEIIKTKITQKASPEDHKVTGLQFAVLGVVVALMAAQFMSINSIRSSQDDLTKKVERLTSTVAVNSTSILNDRKPTDIQVDYEDEDIDDSAEEAVESRITILDVSEGIHLNTYRLSYHSGTNWYDVDYEGNNTVYFDVDFENNSNDDVYLASYDFKLKTANDVSYFPTLDDEASIRFSNADELQNKKILEAQSLFPGEKLSATLPFRMPADLNGTFTLYYGSEMITVTIL